jgi:hypothetical protein
VSSHVLYRFYDADCVLLYIGITKNPPARFDGHRRDKPWWTEVADIKLTQYPDRESVLEAERQAIIDEKPAWNVVYNGRRPRGPRSNPGRVASSAPGRLVNITSRYGKSETLPLGLYYEVHLDPISDDYLPSETPASELFDIWCRQIEERHQPDLPSGSTWVPIYWFVSGPSLFESAMSEQSGYRSRSPFLDYYTQPIDAATGERVELAQLPVLPKRWTRQRSDKGGFIHEATGWTPLALSPYVSLGYLKLLSRLPERAEAM